MQIPGEQASSSTRIRATPKCTRKKRWPSAPLAGTARACVSASPRLLPPPGLPAHGRPRTHAHARLTHVSLSFAPHVSLSRRRAVDALHEWWLCAASQEPVPREGEGGNTVAERVLSKAHYVDMLVLVYKAMIEADEFELAEAYDAAEEDYERDVQGGAAGMTRGLFCDAMFELCDLWCRTSQVGEYVAFLLGLLDQLTTRAAGGGGQRTWRSVDNVCYNPIYADWGQQGAGAEHDAAGEWARGRKQQEEEGSGTGRDEGPHSSGGVDGVPDGRRLSKRFSYSKAARLSHATGTGTGPGNGGSGSQQASSRSSRPSFALRGPGGLSGGGGGGEGGPIWWADHAARMQGNSSATAGGQQQPSSLDTMLGSDRWSSGRSSRQTDASGDAEEGGGGRRLSWLRDPRRSGFRPSERTSLGSIDEDGGAPRDEDDDDDDDGDYDGERGGYGAQGRGRAARRRRASGRLSRMSRISHSLRSSRAAGGAREAVQALRRAAAGRAIAQAITRSFRRRHASPGATDGKGQRKGFGKALGKLPMPRKKMPSRFMQWHSQGNQGSASRAAADAPLRPFQQLQQLQPPRPVTALYQPGRKDSVNMALQPIDGPAKLRKMSIEPVDNMDQFGGSALRVARPGTSPFGAPSGRRYGPS